MSRQRQSEARATQEDRILCLLESRGEEWTSALELSRISLQYCRAVNTLRKRGLIIENRIEPHGQSKFGFYRLARKREASPIIRLPASAINASLFPDSAEPGAFQYPD